MKLQKIQKKIKRRKYLLNLLLNILPPTNKLMIFLSQDLDKYISYYQMYLSKVHRKRKRFILLSAKFAA